MATIQVQLGMANMEVVDCEGKGGVLQCYGGEELIGMSQQVKVPY